jgi:MarR family transcriptional regulator for hemolysin
MKDGTEQISYLMKAILKKWRSILDSRLASLDMSEARWLCLLQLGRAGATPQVELADAVGITPPTLVKLLDRLEDDGWVQRLPEPHDRRAKRVSLTPKAQEMVTLIENEALQLRKEVWKGIPTTDRQACLRVLQQLEKTLDSIPSKTAMLGENL